MHRRSNTHHREAIIDAHSVLLHHVPGDGYGGQIQALRWELRGEMDSLRVGMFRKPREGRAPIVETQAGLSLRRRSDGRDLKLFISETWSVKRLDERRNNKKEKKDRTGGK